jgi:carbon monoxide dehydrogenase subunit G
MRWPPGAAGRSSGSQVKVERSVEVAATPVEAFAKLSDVKVLSSLFTGFMEWYPTEAPNRFRTITQAGPAPLGGEVELEFWPESGAVSWHATRGVHQLGRFLIRRSDAGSEVTLRVFYHLDGGIASRLAEWLASMTVGRAAEEALTRLRRSIEAQPPRRRKQAA